MTQLAHQPTTDQTPHPKPYARLNLPVLTPIEPAPLRPHQIEAAKRDQQDFEQQFPPLKAADPDILILNWEEIERQFLDLCSPWDRQAILNKLTLARQMAVWETPEKTFRWLWVLAHCSSDRDMPAPRSGSGARYPMP